MNDEWINWQALESSIPLDELPSFHREFLKLARPNEADWDKVFLRQIQGKVQATLKMLEREGKAKQENNHLFVLKYLIPNGYFHYLSQFLDSNP
jgi:hypothetical protein